MTQVFDRADWHLDEAPSMELAARHLGWFLWWAVSRGLTHAGEHPVAALQAGSARYILVMCDRALRLSDFTGDGVSFTDRHYTGYLEQLVKLSELQGSDSVFSTRQPEVTRQALFRWLDEQLAAWRPQTTIDNRPMATISEHDLGEIIAVLSVDGDELVRVDLVAVEPVVLRRVFVTRTIASTRPERTEDVLAMTELVHHPTPLEVGRPHPVRCQLSAATAGSTVRVRLEFTLGDELEVQVAHLVSGAGDEPC